MTDPYQEIFAKYLLDLTLNIPGSIVATQNMFNLDANKACKLFKKMNDMGMTGSKIWCGYKFSNCDTNLFIKNLENTDKKMIKYINEMVDLGGCGNSTRIIIK